MRIFLNFVFFTYSYFPPFLLGLHFKFPAHSRMRMQWMFDVPSWLRNPPVLPPSWTASSLFPREAGFDLVGGARIGACPLFSRCHERVVLCLPSHLVRIFFTFPVPFSFGVPTISPAAAPSLVRRMLAMPEPAFPFPSPSSPFVSPSFWTAPEQGQHRPAPRTSRPSLHGILYFPHPVL